MCSAPNVYMFVYILIGTHMVPLTHKYPHKCPKENYVAITRLIAHFTCDVMSESICRHRKRVWSYMTLNVLTTEARYSETRQTQNSQTFIRSHHNFMEYPQRKG